MEKLRRIGVIVTLVSLMLTALSSCTTYGYSMVTYNETTAKQRDHDIIGSITIPIKPTAELFKEEKGIRAKLLEEARLQYGDDIDDVVNVSTSQSYTPAGYSGSYYYFFIRGDVIKYKEYM